MPDLPIRPVGLSEEEDMVVRIAVVGTWMRCLDVWYILRRGELNMKSVRDMRMKRKSRRMRNGGYLYFISGFGSRYEDRCSKGSDLMWIGYWPIVMLYNQQAWMVSWACSSFQSCLFGGAE